MKAFGLEGYDESAFDELFAAVPVSGVGTGHRGAETIDLEPLEYPEDGPRMRILEAVTEVERLDSAEFSGILLVSPCGALPVRASGEERPLVRAVSYGLGFSEDGGHVLDGVLGELRAQRAHRGSELAARGPGHGSGGGLARDTV